MTQCHDSTSNPADAGCNSDNAQYSSTPSLRSPGFEDEDEDEDDDEAPCKEIGQSREGSNHL